jgi:uncharacterized membrane protein YwaF
MGVLGFLTLGQYVLGWELGIDQLLFTEPPADAGTAFPGRMGPNTALTFLLLGGALLSLSVETEKGYRIGQGLALAAWLIPLLAFMGYAYSSVSLYGIASMTQMALHTSPALLLLSAACLLARPDRSVMQTFTSQTVGSVMARRLLPAAVGIPAVIGWRP